MCEELELLLRKNMIMMNFLDLFSAHFIRKSVHLHKTHTHIHEISIQSSCSDVASTGGSDGFFLGVFFWKTYSTLCIQYIQIL